MSENLAIIWKDLTFIYYSLTLLFHKKETIILNKLNGYLEFETITALMGRIGTGKSTLLKCLNGSMNVGLAEESKILTKNNKLIRKCFISQDADQHIMKGLLVFYKSIYFHIHSKY